MLARSLAPAAALALFALAGCAESHGTCTADDCPDASGSDAGPGSDAGLRADGGGCLAHAPAAHRTAGSACDHVRPPGSSPDFEGPPASCTTDADCTEGENGRCNGNGHDGWRCTYDACFADADCSGTSVCECEGSFRSDANSCLPGNCRTDGDCATGFCSPTLGSCGDYTGTTGWFCHTCEDECVDDADCATGVDAGFFGRPYCAFEPTAGHWVCMNTHCAG